jgi:hypothetical protein
VELDFVGMAMSPSDFAKIFVARVARACGVRLPTFETEGDTEDDVARRSCEALGGLGGEESCSLPSRLCSGLKTARRLFLSQDAWLAKEVWAQYEGLR